jgi:hypothetical protein
VCIQPPSPIRTQSICKYQRLGPVNKPKRLHHPIVPLTSLIDPEVVARPLHQNSKPRGLNILCAFQQGQCAPVPSPEPSSAPCDNAKLSYTKSFTFLPLATVVYQPSLQLTVRHKTHNTCRYIPRGTCRYIPRGFHIIWFATRERHQSGFQGIDG